MPRLLHRKRRSAPLSSARTCVNTTAAGGGGGGNAPAALKVLGGSGRTVSLPPVTEGAGRGGAGAASAAGEVLAAVWDLPPLGGHDGAAAELREELCRLAAVAIQQQQKEDEIESRIKEIERLETEQKALLQQKQTKKDDQQSNRNQLHEQLKVALVKIEKLTKDLNKLTELEEDFKTQITHLETMAKSREQTEKELRSELELIESERKRWEERETEYLEKIEELRNHVENANKVAEESMKIEISILQNECNSRRENITKLESKVEKLELSNDSLNQTVQNLHEKVTALEQQSEELRAYIEHLEHSEERNSNEEVKILTKKVEALEDRARESEQVIVDLRQAIFHLEAADEANQEVNTTLGARVEAAELEAMSAVALRDRLLDFLDGETIPQNALQTDDDILAAVTNLFTKYKMEEEHCQQRIEQLEARLNELESGKDSADVNELYYQSQQMEVQGTTEVIDSLQEKLAQSQAAEQEARAMLEELQAKLRYLESVERQGKDMMLNFQGKFRFPENPEQQMFEPYQLEQPIEHPTLLQYPDALGQHPLELQHQFLHPHPLQFHVPYQPEYRFQYHPSKEPSRHHLPTLQPIPTLQPLQPIAVPVPMSQPQLSKGTKKKQRQCFKCQKFGHLAKQCPGETTCVVCGDRGHTHNECNTNEARCANCHGPHRASSKTCPVRISWCSSFSADGEAQLVQA